MIDDNWATVGSSNIDPFSLLLAREANVFVRNADFVGPFCDAAWKQQSETIREPSTGPLEQPADSGPAVDPVLYGVARGLMSVLG